MTKEEHRLIDEFQEGTLSRRDLIKGLLAAGVGVTALPGLLTAAGVDVADAQAIAGSRMLAPKRGGTIRFGTVVPASDVDPVTMFNEGAIFTAQLGLEYLCFPRANYTLEPKLAVNWHAPNPRTWVFNLRPNVKWHNGQPFVPEDVVATFDRLTDPKVNSAALSAFKGVLSKGHTRKSGPHQVTFHLDKGYVDFPYLLSGFTYNSTILPHNYKIGDYVKGGIGTGPFILTRYTPKVGATYVVNKNYWNKAHNYAGGLQLKYYADNSSQVLALQADAIDVFLDMPYQGSQALFGAHGVRVKALNSSAYREFHMRVDQKPFNDARVRQAVAYCLDRNALIQGLWHGYASVGNDHPFAPIFPTSKTALKKLPQRTQDYNKAKQLLAAAGYPHGFSATLTTEQFLEIPQYAEYIQQQLKPAGITVKLNVEDQNTYYGSGSNQPWLEVPFGIVDWAPRGTAAQLISPAYPCGAIWNTPHWCNNYFDGRFDAYNTTLNLGHREYLAFQMAQTMYNQTPAIIAYWIKELRAMRTNVFGLPVSSSAIVDPAGVWKA